MKKYLRIALLLLSILLCATSVQASAKWEVLKTDYYTIFYPQKFEEQAYQVLQILEYYRPAIEDFTGNSRQKLPIVINDMGVMANGLANPFLNWIQLFWYPPVVGQIGTIEDWNSLVAVHEYTHILQLTNSSKGPGILTNIFGDILSPNSSLPGWLIEGLAIYSESKFWNYQGRLNDGKYDAYIGARVADGRFPTILEATFSPYGFDLDGIYTYGSLFVNYLAKTYGEEQVTEFINVHGSSWYSIDDNAATVFGKDFRQLWQDWEVYETNRFKNFSIDGRQVTRKGWYLNSPLLLQDHEESSNKLYYQTSKPIQVDAGITFNEIEIVEHDLATQVEKVVLSTTSSFALPLRGQGNRLYYGVYQQQPGYANMQFSSIGGTVQLRIVNLDSGEDSLVFTGEIRAYDLLPNGDIIYAKASRNHFGSEIYLYNDGQEKLLYEVDYLIDEIISNEQHLVMAARQTGRNTDLYYFNLATGELEQILSTPYAEYGLSLNGDQLFFHANYDLVYAVYCYDLASNKLYKLTDGNFASYPVYEFDTKQLYFVGLNSYGYDLYSKEISFNEYRVGDYPEEVWPQLSLDGIEVTKGSYLDNIKTLKPKVKIPFYLASSEEFALGLSFLGGDALGVIPVYATNLAYDFKQGQFTFDSAFDFNLFAPLSLSVSYLSGEYLPLALDVRYPLLNRIAPDTKGIFLGSKFAYGGKHKTEITPYTILTLQEPAMSANFYLEMPYIPANLTGNQRVGYYGGIEVAKYQDQSKLGMRVHGIHVPDYPGQVLPKIRGYGESLATNIGAIYTLESSFPILAIRKGSWPLGIYFEDLWSNIFVDAALANEGQFQLAGGLELYQEIKLDLGISTLSISPGIGVSLNKDDQYSFHLVVKGSL